MRSLSGNVSINKMPNDKHMFVTNETFMIKMAGALVQWLKLPALKVRDRRFEPRCGIQVSKKQNVSYSRSLVMIEYCGEPP